jgi:DNA-directed RNA polymerase specialized sigma24 family protein
MDEDAHLRSLSSSSLCFSCGRETRLFFERRKHDPRFCFELFRRAALERDERAWECLYHQYQSLVGGWVERNSLFSSCDEERDYFVNRAFQKLWNALTPTKFPNFHDLKSILGYLQVCVHSVLVDHLRARERATLLEDEHGLEPAQLATEAESPEQEAIRRTQAEALWSMLDGKLKNRKEQRVLYGSFVLGLKPADLFKSFPGEFQDVKEVYTLKENLLARLRRDQDLLNFLQNF